MEAENTYQVFDWLWSSGQLSEKDIACLPSLGIEAVINLAPPTSLNALRAEAEFVAREGISYIQIPVEWERPELHQLVRFFGILNAFCWSQSLGALCKEYAGVCFYLPLPEIMFSRERGSVSPPNAGYLGAKRNVASIYS